MIFMKALALTRNEKTICLFMLGFLTIGTGLFLGLNGLANDAPVQLCPAPVSIMSTTVADIVCR